MISLKKFRELNSNIISSNDLKMFTGGRVVNTTVEENPQNSNHCDRHTYEATYDNGQAMDERLVGSNYTLPCPGD